MKKHDQNKQDEGNSKEKDKKGKKTVANIAEDEVTTESASLASVFKSSLPSDDNGDVYVFIASEVITLLSCESSHDTFIDSGCSCNLSPCCKYFLDETLTTLKKPIKVYLGDRECHGATLGFSRVTRTHTHQNPHPRPWARVFVGTGSGFMKTRG